MLSNMLIETQLSLSPRDYRHRLTDCLAAHLQHPCETIEAFYITHQSIDARRKPIVVHVTARVNLRTEQPPQLATPVAEDVRVHPQYRDVSGKSEVIIVGSGPAGLFAALKSIECGIRPIVLERGKDVSARKRDIAQLNRSHQLDPESNYCFGEGGAGTFSDGKLFTRSKKRGDNQRILEIFCAHGADPRILYEAHPHIGSDKLPSIISRMRETIVRYGGEVRFSACVEKMLIHENRIHGVTLRTGEEIHAPHVILATGHSARDIYQTLHQQNIPLEAKGFAMGVRIEHPQAIINRIQYKKELEQLPFLPPASYSLVTQVQGRGVYSFCMCPGGFIVPAATEPETIVVNGMSASHRSSPFANAGVVVELRIEDVPGSSTDPLRGLREQQRLERLAYQFSGGGQCAPAQRVTDFLAHRISHDLPETSYIPGLSRSALHEWLPAGIRTRLEEGLRAFDKKLQGFIMRDAILVGVESRTSSPVRIPRNRETFEHPSIHGLYPCGEGAGYAGGILSSAVDGENCAEAAARACV